MNPIDVPCEDQLALADQRALGGRVLLQHDAREAVLAGPVIPQHVDEVLPAVVVVKERRIEAAAVQVDRIRPVAVDPRAGDEVVVKVAKRRAGGARPATCGRSASRRCRSDRRDRPRTSGTAPRCRTSPGRRACSAGSRASADASAAASGRDRASDGSARPETTRRSTSRCSSRRRPGRSTDRG